MIFYNGIYGILALYIDYKMCYKEHKAKLYYEVSYWNILSIL